MGSVRASSKPRVRGRVADPRDFLYALATQPTGYTGSPFCPVGLPFWKPILNLQLDELERLMLCGIVNQS